MKERTTASRCVFDGRIVRLEVHDVELEDGRTSVRELVRHAPAVGVVARLPDDSFLFVRQYRKAVEREVLEVCAGLVDPGEDAGTAARRELREETGRAAASLRHLGRIYSSPGWTDEYADLFAAECGGPAAAADLDHDEHVEVVRLCRDEVLAAIRSGRIDDGKTLAAWMLYTAGDA